jgi:hypothetical protein
VCHAPLTVSGTVEKLEWMVGETIGAVELSANDFRLEMMNLLDE